MSPHLLKSKKSPTLFFSALVMVNKSSTSSMVVWRYWYPYLTQTGATLDSEASHTIISMQLQPVSHNLVADNLHHRGAVNIESACYKMEVTLSGYIYIYICECMILLFLPHTLMGFRAKERRISSCSSTIFSVYSYLSGRCSRGITFSFINFLAPFTKQHDSGK